MSEQAKILIVDDGTDILEFSRRFLPGTYKLEHIRSTKQALGRLKKNEFGLILLDKNFSTLSPDELLGPAGQVEREGLTFLKALGENVRAVRLSRAQSRGEPPLPNLPVIMLTHHADLASAAEALRLGAFDFLEWEALAADPMFLTRAVERALEWKKKGKAELIARFNALGFIGESAAMVKLFAQLDEAAKSDANLLLTGETGTGKELAAQVVHILSVTPNFVPLNKGDRPQAEGVNVGAIHESPTSLPVSGRDERVRSVFVPVNCAAIPKDLLEAELFGIAPKTATGVEGRPGKFQAADGGTLFLDEIGEMPPDLQAKLLRVLEDKKVPVLGKTEPVNVDFRLIAASNKNLQRAVAEGTFRADLYHRLTGYEIRLPSLAERREDVLPLAYYFILIKTQVENLERLVPSAVEGSRKVTGKTISGMTPEVKQALVERKYPGNVRELKQLIFRAVDSAENFLTLRDLAKAEKLEPIDWPAGVVREPPLQCTLDSPLPNCPLLSQAKWEDLERIVIRAALQRNGDSVSKAAQALGVPRSTLYEWVNRLGIKTPEPAS